MLVLTALLKMGWVLFPPIGVLILGAILKI